MTPRRGKHFSGIKNLSREQKKIIYIGLIVLALLGLLWSFVYVPQSKKFTAIKKRLAEIEAQIAEITSLTEGKDLATAVGQLKAKLQKVAFVLPAQDEDVISALSEGARKMNIEVKNIMPSGAISLGERVSGYEIQELPISLSLTADFRAIGDYLDDLRNNFPILIRVRDLQIQGKGEARTDLDVSLKLSAYLATEKK